jgi:hypothetical protein
VLTCFAWFVQSLRCSVPLALVVRRLDVVKTAEQGESIMLVLCTESWCICCFAKSTRLSATEQ